MTSMTERLRADIAGFVGPVTWKWPVAGLLLFVFAYLVPINSFIFRSLLLAGLGFFVATLLYLLRRRRPAVMGVGGMAVVPLLFLALPGRPYDSDGLHERYMTAIQSYDGAPYVWGGENRLGIDCSGLVRRALFDAYLHEGIRSLNPALLRKAGLHWWFDASALAMRDAYRAQTERLFAVSSLNSLDHGRIRPGDLAVTADGVHVLSYLGDDTWIEADPVAGRVVRVRIPERELPWFSQPVVLVRWQEFS